MSRIGEGSAQATGVGLLCRISTPNTRTFPYPGRWRRKALETCSSLIPININAIAVDGLGDWFIAEPGMQAICEITTDGIINTIAGRPNVFLRRFPGREVPFGIRAMAARQMADFSSVTVRRAGNVYVADTSNDAIRVARPAP
jgi:hypothetical protein